MWCTSWRWVVRLGLAFSVGCFCLWVFSFSKPFQTVPVFLESGRSVMLAHSFVYVDVSRPLTPSEQGVIRQMNNLEAKVRRREVPPVPTFGSSNSQGSGDGWLLFGWDHEWSMRRVGPYSGITERRTGLWISPWAGVLAGLIPLAMARCGQAWQQRVIQIRQSGGRCTRCGYDLRFRISSRLASV